VGRPCCPHGCSSRGRGTNHSHIRGERECLSQFVLVSHGSSCSSREPGQSLLRNIKDSGRPEASATTRAMSPWCANHLTAPTIRSPQSARSSVHLATQSSN